MILRWLLIYFSLTLFFQTDNLAKACSFNCGSSHVIQQKDPGGPAVKYGNKSFNTEIPEKERPNDATISLYEDGRRVFFQKRKLRGNMYSIPAKGNAEPFKITKNPKSKILEKN